MSVRVNQIQCKKIISVTDRTALTYMGNILNMYASENLLINTLVSKGVPWVSNNLLDPRKPLKNMYTPIEMSNTSGQPTMRKFPQKNSANIYKK